MHSTHEGGRRERVPRSRWLLRWPAASAFRFLGRGAFAAVLIAAMVPPTMAMASAVRSMSRARAEGPRVPVLHWRLCDGGFQCSTARVPLSYQHPRGALISIAVIRHVATDPAHSVGTLFVNGGGPAEQIEPFVAEYPLIPAVLRERFDIVTFDPRGFGFSSAIRCFPSLAAENKVLAPVEPYPTFPVGTAQTRTFERIYATIGSACARSAGALLLHDTTADEARDMNLLRLAMGVHQLGYIGLSYGTGLGAVYANLFPSTVGRMVLDGNLNPVAWTRGGRLPAFVRMGNGPNFAAQTRTFLSLCGQQAPSVCAFSAGSGAATRAKFATLLKRLSRRPVVVGGQSVGYADVFEIVPPGDVSDWQPAAAALQDLWVASGGAGGGSGASKASGVSKSAVAPASSAAVGPYLGLVQSLAVLCLDTGDSRQIGDYVAAARAGVRAFSGFGELAAWEEAPCAYWPRAAGQDRYTGPWNRKTAATILVIGNTGDPTTPYANSEAMARELGRARLLTVKGFGHTEFFNPSICASDYEFRYLITGKLPPAGTVCPQSVQPF
jgi:pimeloyl-ACP methyl ester carboxylesterase